MTMHVAPGRWKTVVSTFLLTSLACMSSSGFAAKLETFRAQLEVMTTQAQRCVQELRAIGGNDPTVAGRLPGRPGVQLVAPSWIPERTWTEVARRQHELDGAQTMIARAADIGPAALDRVVTSLARAHQAYAELCRARDDVATRATLTRVVAAHAATDASVGQFDR